LTSEIGSYDHVIIAFNSSQVPKDLISSDIIIRKNSDNWIGTGLTVDSVVRLHKIITIPKTLIKRRLGRINASLEKEILKKIIHMFEN
jgi:mRNA interferase MazF